MYDVKDRKALTKIQDMHMDPIFRQYTEHKKILDIIECFTGPNIMAIHSMLIVKPPDSGFGSSRYSFKNLKILPVLLNATWKEQDIFF